MQHGIYYKGQSSLVNKIHKDLGLSAPIRLLKETKKSEALSNTIFTF